MHATERSTPETQPVPEPIVLDLCPPRNGVVRRARIRVPLTLTVRPWATLYRLPDGREIWCLRLRDDGEVRTRCVPTERLRSYARRSGLRTLEADLRRATKRRGTGGDGAE